MRLAEYPGVGRAAWNAIVRVALAEFPGVGRCAARIALARVASAGCAGMEGTRDPGDAGGSGTRLDDSGALGVVLGSCSGAGPGAVVVAGLGLATTVAVAGPRLATTVAVRTLRQATPSPAILPAPVRAGLAIA